MSEWSLAVALALPFAAAGASALVGPRGGRWTGLLGAAAGAASFAILAVLAATGASPFRVEWIPSAGIAFGLGADGLALFFALLVTGVGAFVFLYSVGYMGHERDHGRFFAYLALFMGSMLGLALASDLILLFVFWEATTVTSFLLIGFHRDERRAVASAYKAFAVTGLGGVALLLAFVAIRNVTGSFDLGTALASGGAIRASASYPWILGLVALAVATKSAQVPFHIWLPDAMVAPTPVSAYLHSAAMVKAGVFLLARLFPAIASPTWALALVPLGLATSVLGGVLAIGALDLKRILAYSTVSQLGLLVALFGLGTTLGAKGGTVHLLSHSLFKATLFLVAGLVTVATARTNIRKLGGLRRAMPATFVACALAALASAGLPPTGGFLSKELALEATSAGAAWAIPVLILSGALTFAYSLYFLARIFLGPAGHEGTKPTPRTMVATAVGLAVLSLGLGIVPAAFTDSLGPAVSATVGRTVALNLSPIPHLGPELAFSGLSFLGGLAILWRYERVSDAIRALTSRSRRVSPDRAYEAAFARGRAAMAAAFLAIQNGSLTRYGSAILLLAVAPLGLVVFATRWEWPDLSTSQNVIVLTVLIAVVGFAAIAAVVRRTLVAVLALSGMGFMIALLFMLLNAPDVALTQLLVEIVFLAIFLIVLFRIPKEYERPPRHGWSDLVVAAVVAIAVVAILSLSLNSFWAPSIAEFYLRPGNVPITGGENIVNVIITDFRALDTLGEATVIALAALGAYSVLRRWDV